MYGNTLIVVVYVNDLVITRNNLDLILRLKRQLVATFEMTDRVILHYFLGLQVFTLSDGVFISQYKYAFIILKCFKMDDCKTCATPFQLGLKLNKECSYPKVDTTLYRQLVSSVIYLTHSHLDLSFVVSVVSRFMNSVVSRFMKDTKEIHWKDVKCIIYYIKGTSHFGIKYCRSLFLLVIFFNSDWVGEGDD